jgi:hypothetical protein
MSFMTPILITPSLIWAWAAVAAQAVNVASASAFQRMFLSISSN